MATQKITVIKTKAVIPDEQIMSKIFLIRNRKVIFARDLAVLYNVKTEVLNQAVKRNIKRFPDNFMFQLSQEEFDVWKSQIVMSKSNKKGLRTRPYVFSEQGVAMLSSILNSNRAIQVNIQIIRTFVKLREIISTHKDLQRKLDAMEKKYDEQFKIVFTTIKQLLAVEEEPKRKIGF